MGRIQRGLEGRGTQGAVGNPKEATPKHTAIDASTAGNGSYSDDHRCTLVYFNERRNEKQMVVLTSTLICPLKKPREMKGPAPGTLLGSARRPRFQATWTVVVP